MVAQRELPRAPFSLDYVREAVSLDARTKANRERLKRRREQIDEIIILAEAIIKDHPETPEELSEYNLDRHGVELVGRSKGVPVNLGFGSNQEARIGVTQLRRIFSSEFAHGMVDTITTIDIRLSDKRKGCLFMIDRSKSEIHPSENSLRPVNRLNKTASDADLKEAIEWLNFIDEHLA